jgi:hypothetical protein
MNMEKQITADILLRLVNGASLTPVRASFCYVPSDPYSVRVIFRTDNGGIEAEWVFGRDLTTTGMTRETGLGDVRIWPSESPGVKSVFICLTSPDGTALLECPSEPLAAFLDSTYAAVPYGAEEEYLDMDDAIKKLLDGDL